MSMMILRSHRDLLSRQPAVALTSGPRRTVSNAVGVFEVIDPDRVAPVATLLAAPIFAEVAPPPPAAPRAPQPMPMLPLAPDPLVPSGLLDPDADCERWDGLS